MFGDLRVLRTGGVLAVTAVSLSLVTGAASAAPAKAGKGKQTVSGSISWTVTTTKVDDSDPTDLSRTAQTITKQEEHRLQVNAVRDPKYTRTYVFKRGQAGYNYTYSETRVTTDYSFGQVSCTTTTKADASGTGKTDVTPTIFGKYKPNKDVLVIDKRTKGISVGAVLPAKGSSTTTIVGAGTSPCQEGSYTDPVDDQGSTSLNDSRNVCLPGGVKPYSSLRPLFGKWNNSKKRFDFACSQTFTDGPETTSIRISGSLKYKR